MKKGTPEYLEFRRKANEANRKYYSKPEIRERKKVYAKKYRIENKEKISEYGYKIRAKPEVQERLKKWREENIEHVREYQRRPENRKKKRESDKEYYRKVRKNPENVKKERLRAKEFRDNNPEVVRKYNQKYYTSPKGIISYTNHNHRRLALIKSPKCDLTNKRIKQIYKRDKVCVYCSSDKKLELDHIIPLAKGGTCLWINYVLACEKCNRSKSDREVHRWCNLMNKAVPRIVIKLLDKQSQGI